MTSFKFPPVFDRRGFPLVNHRFAIQDTVTDWPPSCRTSGLYPPPPSSSIPFAPYAVDWNLSGSAILQAEDLERPSSVPPNLSPNLSRNTSSDPIVNIQSPWGSQVSLYTIDEPYESRSPSRSLSASCVKAESDDGCFIMEMAPPEDHASGDCPPTTVPLRATQACAEMRRMMGSFRINPFTMHSGSGKGKASSVEEARPLEQEPLLIEFQIELTAPLTDSEARTEPLASDSSRGRQLKAEDGHDWRGYMPQEASYSPELESDYLPGSFELEPARRQNFRQHYNSSHPYHAPPFESHLNSLRISTRPRSIRPSRTYGSPDQNNVTLPSLTQSNRQWSGQYMLG